jgi:hypothetical protein
MAYMHTREFPRFYPIYHKLPPAPTRPLHYPEFRVTPARTGLEALKGLGTFRIGGGFTLGTVAVLGGLGLLAYWVWMKGTETRSEREGYQRHRLQSAGAGWALP